MAYVDGITEERHVMTMPCIADDEIQLYRIVQAAAVANEVKAATSGVQYPIGITRDASENGKAVYEAEDPIELAIYGVAYLEMYSNGFRGDKIMATAGGLGARHTTQDGVYIIGNASKNWKSGEVIPIIIDRYMVGDFSESA